MMSGTQVTIISNRVFLHSGDSHVRNPNGCGKPSERGSSGDKRGDVHSHNHDGVSNGGNRGRRRNGNGICDASGGNYIGPEQDSCPWSYPCFPDFRESRTRHLPDLRVMSLIWTLLVPGRVCRKVDAFMLLQCWLSSQYKNVKNTQMNGVLTDSQD